MKSKLAIVTGGGQSIGKAIARELLLKSYSVVIADKDETAGQEAESELSSLGPVSFRNCDVSNETSVKDLVQYVDQHWNRLDALVNNAGIMVRKTLAELTLEEWNKVLSTNLTGAFLCSKYFAPQLKAFQGAIINISSTRAFMSEPDTEAYSASKGGLFSLTHSLAASLAPNVRVNCISPGWIEVSEWKKSEERKSPDLSQEDHSQHWSGRVGKPEDIASMVAYLLSPESSFITGSNFVIDGGMTRKMIYV